MRSSFLLLLLSAGILSLPGEAAGQNRKGKAETALPQDYAQLGAVREVVGRLTSGAGGKSIAFEVEITRTEKNPNYRPPKITVNNRNNGNQTNLIRQMQNLQRQQAQIARIRDPRDRQRRMIQLQQQMARMQQQMQQQALRQQQDLMRRIAQARSSAAKSNNGPFRIVKTTKEFMLNLTDGAVVRWNTPPTEYDEKGFLKKYTPEDLRKMKGSDSRLPGYEAEIEDLQPGQLVRLYLNPPGKQKAAAPKVDLLGAEDLLGGDGDSGSRPTIRMVLIMPEQMSPFFPEKR